MRTLKPILIILCAVVLIALYWLALDYAVNYEPGYVAGELRFE